MEIDTSTRSDAPAPGASAPRPRETAEPAADAGRRTGRGGSAVVEVVRLGIVVAFTGGGFALGPMASDVVQQSEETSRLVTSLLGALTGYLAGGFVGRGFLRGVDTAQERLQRIDAAVLISAAVGAGLAGVFAMLLLWPVLLLPFQQLTLPLAMVVLIAVVYGGGRLGAARGGDLLRFVGARGRLQVSSPSRGGGVKLVDTSALMDARLVEVARAGFLEGTLVVPRFVLEEMQALADVEDRRRRGAARRGMDALKELQDEGLVAVEVTDDDVTGIVEVDAKLAALCRQRQAALITVDANLARVAEISGVRVLNLHGLAEALRPPAIPGDRIRVQVVREGTEPVQGVGYLPDGTMVVIERAAGDVGSWISADVTSIVQNRQGRMLFASRLEDE